jgi:hypothetical protein
VRGGFYQLPATATATRSSLLLLHFFLCFYVCVRARVRAVCNGNFQFTLQLKSKAFTAHSSPSNSGNTNMGGGLCAGGWLWWWCVVVVVVGSYQFTSFLFAIAPRKLTTDVAFALEVL